MGCAISIATFRHYIEFLDNTQSFSNDFEDAWPKVGGALAIALFVAFVAYMIYVFVTEQTKSAKFEMPISWVVGGLFGLGLVLSGMCRRSKILNFLTIYEDWDPSLMLVMGGAVGVNVFTFPLIIYKKKTPVYGEKM